MANDDTPDSPADDDPAELAEHADLAELEALVGEWLTVPDIAERLGLRLSDVRQLITDREVPSLRIGHRHVVTTPAKEYHGAGRARRGPRGGAGRVRCV